MALFDDELIHDRVEAWDYGPVIPSLYHTFKRFGNDEIARENYDILGPRVDQNDTKAIALLGKVWEVYGNMTGLRLSTLTHKKDGPWHTVTSQNRTRNGTLPNNLWIPNQVIKNYFTSKTNKKKSQT